MMSDINDELILAARLLLATLFLIFGWRKVSSGSKAHTRTPSRQRFAAIYEYTLSNASIEYFPASVIYSSKKPPIMLRSL